MSPQEAPEQTRRAKSGSIHLGGGGQEQCPYTPGAQATPAQGRRSREERQTGFLSLLTPGQPRLFPLDLRRERDPPVRDLQLRETGVGSTPETGGERRTQQQVDSPDGFQEPLPTKRLCASSRQPTRNLRFENPPPPHLKKLHKGTLSAVPKLSLG